MNPISVLVLSLSMASVLSLELTPFKVRQLTNASISTGVQSRIYGGNEAAEGQFTYMIFALIKLPDGRVAHCSASLITPKWVLLAAHCVQYRDLQERNIILAGGKASLKDYLTERLNLDFDKAIEESKYRVWERRAKKFFIHPKYDENNLHHDVALVELKKPFDMQHVTSISLSYDEIKNEKTCMILGWGLTRGNKQPYKLNFVEDKKVITTKMGCLAKYSGPHICLRPDNRGICQGDSGSPLVCDGKVWGVASHFVSSHTNPDCGDSIEEYYSELYPELDWIDKTMRGSAYKSVVTSFSHLLACAFLAVWWFDKM